MQRGSPITPDQVDKFKEPIPEEVYDAFNTLILKNYRNGRAKVLLSEVTKVTIENFQKTTREIVEIDQEWFNVEDVYRAVGWKVEYTQPDYTEFFPPYYVFTKKL